jgi:hypothetical protein
VKDFLVRIIYMLVIIAGLVTLSGCITDEPENVSSRPWNTSRGWDSGMPSSINEGK